MRPNERSRAGLYGGVGLRLSYGRGDCGSHRGW